MFLALTEKGLLFYNESYVEKTFGYMKPHFEVNQTKEI